MSALRTVLAFACLVLMVAPAPANAQTPYTPAPGSPYDVGGYMSEVDLADLDADGILDLVAVASDSLRVRLGDGTGAFPVAPAGDPYPSGQFPFGIATGDVDGDGDIDVATAQYGADTVRVYLNSGTGVMTPQAPLASGDATADVELADLDRDGDLDLISSEENSDTLGVRLNDGGGTFGDRTVYATGDIPRIVAAGDLNGDDLPDVATAHLATDSVHVRFARPNGTLSDPPLVLATGDNPRAIELVDVDGDGDRDVATGNVFDNTLTVQLNDGLGRFAQAPGSPAPFGFDPEDLAFGDLDGDGRIDVVEAETGANRITAWLGDGTGGFRTPVEGMPHSLSSSASSVASGDLDRDGDLDIVASSQDDGRVHVLLRTGPRALGTSTEAVEFGEQPVGSLSASQPVTVINSVGRGVRIGSVKVTGADREDFTISVDDCTGETLAPIDGACELRVRFAPTAAGARGAVLQIRTAGTGALYQVALSGTASPVVPPADGKDGMQGPAGPVGPAGPTGPTGPVSAPRQTRIACADATARRTGRRYRVTVRCAVLRGDRESQFVSVRLQKKARTLAKRTQRLADGSPTLRFTVARKPKRGTYRIRFVSGSRTLATATVRLR